MDKLITYRPATQEDFDYVQQHPFEDAVKSYPHTEVPDDNCYAVIYEGALVAVGGLQVRRKGVGLLFLFLTAECKKKGVHGVRAICAIREKVNELIKNNGIWRAEAAVRVDFSKAIEMIEFLGFQREGLMRQANPDRSDSFLYSKIME